MLWGSHEHFNEPFDSMKGRKFDC